MQISKKTFTPHAMQRSMRFAARAQGGPAHLAPAGDAHAAAAGILAHPRRPLSLQLFDELQCVKWEAQRRKNWAAGTCAGPSSPAEVLVA